MRSLSPSTQTTSTSTFGPTITERRLQSSVTVQDGETVALGGLIQDTNSNTKNGIPLLSDIPVIGAVFGTTDRNVQRTELLVLLSPKNHSQCHGCARRDRRLRHPAAYVAERQHTRALREVGPVTPHGTIREDSRRRSTPGGRAGAIALILVIWVLTSGAARAPRSPPIRAVLRVGFARSPRSRQLQASADAGTRLAVMGLLDPIVAARWQADGRIYNRQYAGRKYCHHHRG